MAHENILRTCGHSDRIGLVGAERERSRTRSYEQSRMCADCYRADQQRRAASAAEASGLPTLVGSEAQTRWALTIRQARVAELAAILAEAEALAARAEASGTLTSEQLTSNATVLRQTRQALAGIRRQAEAKYWIERRDLTAREHFARVYKVIREREALAAQS